MILVLVPTNADRFDQVFREVRGRGDIQYGLPAEPKPSPPPDWLLALGRAVRPFFEAIGRALKWVFNLMPGAGAVQIGLWLLLAGFVAFLLFVILRRAKERGRLWWRSRQLSDESAEDDWAPDAALANQWLEKADALAREGRFADAIHSLLLRSIEDLAARRPQLRKKSLTGRELASSAQVPPRARTLFAGIVALVEPSWFGGRPVGEGEWTDARNAYREFALAGAWRS